MGKQMSRQPRRQPERILTGVHVLPWNHIIANDKASDELLGVLDKGEVEDTAHWGIGVADKVREVLPQQDTEHTGSPRPQGVTNNNQSVLLGTAET